MLRALPRAVSSSSPLRSLPLQRAFRLQQNPAPACERIVRHQQTRTNAVHAISNPTLAGIEKRWEAMPPQEQAELWMALRDRMKNDWHDLTVQERKASYWIAFGPHGPRAMAPPGQDWFVFTRVMFGLAISFAIFICIRLFARPPPKTLNEEWQKMTNEYLKSQNVEPITGISSEGYKGKGMVYSPPLGKKPPAAEDEEEE